MYTNCRLNVHFHATKEIQTVDHTRSKVRKWIYDNGQTVHEFCQALGINRCSFYRWIRGDLKPRPRSMAKIKRFTKGFIAQPEDLLDKHAPE